MRCFLSVLFVAVLATGCGMLDGSKPPSPLAVQAVTQVAAYHTALKLPPDQKNLAQVIIDGLRHVHSIEDTDVHAQDGRKYILDHTPEAYILPAILLYDLIVDELQKVKFSTPDEHAKYLDAVVNGLQAGFDIAYRKESK